MNTKKEKRLPFWWTVRRHCFCDVLDDDESRERHSGPFVCLRDMFGRKYYLCLTCFYTMLDEERELNEYMMNEDNKNCMNCGRRIKAQQNSWDALNCNSCSRRARDEWIPEGKDGIS
jgi:uncharacterized CHY-type Zn-finger protein